MDRYKKLSKLGTGSYGKAYLAVSNVSNRQYVIKEMEVQSGLSREDRDRMFNEISIIRSCSHINIIRYKEFFITNGDTLNSVPIISIVMEYADDGDLNQCIKRRRETKKYFSEGLVRNWLIQITLALQYLHKKSILHRDLKTQNIFMTKNGLLKLGDFGISRTLRDENDFATTGIGTPQYLSPEICRQQKYNYKSDIWSLGCVLFEMCALQPAFTGSDFGFLIQSILKGKYQPIPSPHFSTSLAELVKVMLRPDPNRRPTASQIIAAKVLDKDLKSYLDYINSLPVNFGSGEFTSSSESSVDPDSQSSIPSLLESVEKVCAKV